MEPAVVSVDDLVGLAGLDFRTLPQSYDEWRLVVDVYVLIGRTVYLLANHHLLRYKVLTGTELGMVFSSRLLPLADDAEPEGAMAFLVVVPSRAASLAGLRGFRWALMAAGRAHSALEASAITDDSVWMWETEFLDDAAARVLSVDGMERIPVVVGRRVFRTETA